MRAWSSPGIPGLLGGRVPHGCGEHSQPEVAHLCFIDESWRCAQVHTESGLKTRGPPFLENLLSDGPFPGSLQCH